MKPRNLTALFCLIALLSFPANALAAESADSSDTSRWNAARVGSAIFDVAVLRPFGFVVLVIGSGLFVPAAILTSPNGLDEIREALDFFVKQPAEDVFQRPLGDF